MPAPTALECLPSTITPHLNLFYLISLEGQFFLTPQKKGSRELSLVQSLGASGGKPVGDSFPTAPLVLLSHMPLPPLSKVSLTALVSRI